MNHVALRLMRALTPMLYLLALSLPAACALTPAPPDNAGTAVSATLAATAEHNATPTATLEILLGVAPTIVSPPPPGFVAAPIERATGPVQPISPTQPLRAWAVARDNRAVFVLDARQRLFRLTTPSLTVERVSPPLFDAAGDAPEHLIDGGSFLLVGNESANRTLVLDRQDFRQIAAWDRAGPMAVDPNRHVFMAWERGLWAYETDDLSRPPTVVTEGPPLGLGAVPVGLAADPATRQLFATFHDVSASAPHQREAYRVYNLDAPAQSRLLEAQLGTLARPAFASKAGRTVSVLNAKNGFLGSRLLIYDGLQSRARPSPAPLDGIAVTDAEGKRIYLLRERGLWILDGNDLSLRSVLPFTEAPPADLALTADGATLYFFGNGWLAARPAQELDDLGIPPVPGPFPRAWTYPERNEFFRARLFQSPTWESDGTAFVLVGGYGELYRTTDHGRSWQLLPSLMYPGFKSIQRLSLSPDFASDHTLTAHPAMLRSIDAGDSWQPFKPRIAFVSDRDGNREIYTAEQDGSDICRITSDPAADENPAWSPGWTRIAFQTNRSGSWRLYTVAAGCDPTRSGGPGGRAESPLPAVTGGDDMLPAWSPDGRLIAFVSTRDGNPEVYALPYRPDGDVAGRPAGHALRLTFDPAGDWRPAWEPDGLHLAFTSGRSGHNGIYRLDMPAPPVPAGYVPAVTPLAVGPDDNRDPAVSRQGTLAFLSDRDGILRTYRLESDLADAQPLPVSQERQAEAHPAWVDDDSLSVLVTMTLNGTTGVYRSSYAGGHSPVVVSGAFNGHPAWGPPLWQPNTQASQQWLSKVP